MLYRTAKLALESPLQTSSEQTKRTILASDGTMQQPATVVQND